MIQIDNLIKEAMLSKNTELLNVLKLVKAEFLKKQTEPGRKIKELNEEEQIKVLMKMVAQRKDSIEQYEKANREDLAGVERKEMEILNNFLPAQASEEEVAEYTSLAVTIYKATKDDGYKLSMRDMKPIMDIVKEKYPTANGKVISQTLIKIINS